MAGETDDLVIYLPSSVITGDQENTISHYTTRLSAPVKLMPGVEYEAALIKIMYPKTVENCYKSTLEFYSYTFKRRYVTSIENGFYKWPKDLLAALAKVLQTDKTIYKFTFNKVSQRFTVETKRPKDSPDAPSPYMKISENLQVLTGLPGYIMGEGFTSSDNAMDMTGGIQNIYCYCDLVRNVNVGNNLAPVIAVINYESSNVFGPQIEYEAKNPVYVPLRSLEFQDIEVELRSKTGMYIPFGSGESMLVIHVRQKSPSL